MIRIKNIGEQRILLKARSTQAAGLTFDTAFVENDGVIDNIYALLGTAGITGSEIADVHKNGVTIFAAAPKLTFPTTVADATYSLLTAAARKVLKGDRLTLDIDSVHSGTAAIDLWVYIVIRRKTDNSVETNLAPSALT